eukprot:710767-Prorocentrum_minimum.AAC.1
MTCIACPALYYLRERIKQNPLAPESARPPASRECERPKSDFTNVPQRLRTFAKLCCARQVESFAPHKCTQWAHNGHTMGTQQAAEDGCLKGAFRSLLCCSTTIPYCESGGGAHVDLLDLHRADGPFFLSELLQQPLP